RPIRMAMIAITTNSSISVNPRRPGLVGRKSMESLREQGKRESSFPAGGECCSRSTVTPRSMKDGVGARLEGVAQPCGSGYGACQAPPRRQAAKLDRYCCTRFLALLIGK